MSPTPDRAPPRWLPQATADGSLTLFDAERGEACHSRSGAWREARERYALPVGLHARAEAGERACFRLLDVGTGLGLNLAAALEALAGTGAELDALTLELEPGVIEAALALGAAAPAPWHARVLATLARALREPSRAHDIEGGGGRLLLLLGDARASLAATRPEVHFDAVFLDPFSPAVDPPLWQLDFLVEVARRMAPGSWLSTYSAAARVRERLALAGLVVGRGPRVGTKAEGTVATPDGRPEPLSARQARRLERARAAFSARGCLPSADPLP